MATLQMVQAIMGLDYAGVNVRLDAAGIVRPFEAIAVMLTVIPAASGRRPNRWPAIGVKAQPL